MNQKLNVLHIIEGLGYGGTERQLLESVRGMRSPNIQHIVCHLYPIDELAGALAGEGSKVFNLNLRSRNQWYKGLRRLRRIVEQHQVNLIHTYLFDSGLYGRIAGHGTKTPVVSSIVNASYEPEVFIDNPYLPRWKVYARASLERWTGQRMVDRFVAISHFAKHSAVRRLGWPPDRISVVYRGVDTDYFQPFSPERVQSLRASFGLEKDWPVLLTIGRLEPEKGHRYVILAMEEILSHMPTARLLLVGHGRMETELKSLANISGVGGRVHFFGVRDDIREIIAVSDVFLFPSISEGFGVALIEAMAMRKPCVATRIGPIPEIVDDEYSGILIDPLSSSEIAEAVLRVLSSPGLCTEMGVRGREIVEERFSIADVTQQLSSIYHHVANDQPSRAVRFSRA